MTLKINVIANYLGNIWVGIMGLIFIPYYICYLGMEAYGLIGFYSMLQTSMMLLDMGMTPTLSREMARFTGGEHSNQSIRNLLRTVEYICLVIALLFSATIFMSSGWLASNWLKAQAIPDKTIAEAIVIMGLVASLRLAEGLYRGALVGLQRQVEFNITNSIMSTLRGAGAVAVIAFISPTIFAFFLWQVITSALTLTALAYLVYKNLPQSIYQAEFSRDEITKVWRFAGGVTATTALALVLTQVDKVMLSKLLSLDEFGRYTLVITITNVLTMLIGPITQAHFPRLSELKSIGNSECLKTTFHKAAQLGTTISGTAACALILFGDRIVSIWTSNPDLAISVFNLLRITTIGTFLNSLMHMPHILQLSFGWPGLAAKVNLVAVALLVPAILLVTPVYGAIGAAWIWVALNSGYVLIQSQLMFRKILTTEKYNWFLEDLLLPFTASLLVTLLFHQLMPELEGRLTQLAYIVATSIISLVASVFASSHLRKMALNILTTRKNH